MHLQRRNEQLHPITCLALCVPPPSVEKAPSATHAKAHLPVPTRVLLSSQIAPAPSLRPGHLSLRPAQTNPALHRRLHAHMLAVALFRRSVAGSLHFASPTPSATRSIMHSCTVHIPSRERDSGLTHVAQRGDVHPPVHTKQASEMYDIPGRCTTVQHLKKSSG